MFRVIWQGGVVDHHGESQNVHKCLSLKHFGLGIEC
jgi:hypothetical protein